jgi:hypothetical protein
MTDPLTAGPAPTLGREVIDLLASGVVISVASRDADLSPELTFAMGVRVHADGRHITLYLPCDDASATLDNARDAGWLAATFCRPSDDRTVQLKGQLVSVRDSGEEDRLVQQTYRAALVEQFAFVGVPRSVTRQMAWWPSFAVEMSVTESYSQTPGPHAGARLAP